MNVISLLMLAHGSRQLEDFSYADRQRWREDVDQATRWATSLGKHLILMGFSIGGGVALDAVSRRALSIGSESLQTNYIWLSLHGSR